MTARQKAQTTNMMSRSTTSSVTGRASAMRRMRRRANGSTRLYCGTNGCTSFLEIDEQTGTAHCRICGYVRRLH
jgi:hypothetical protein